MLVTVGEEDFVDAGVGARPGPCLVCAQAGRWYRWNLGRANEPRTRARACKEDNSSLVSDSCIRSGGISCLIFLAPSLLRQQV